MNPNRKPITEPAHSLVTSVGSGPIPKGHEPLAEETIGSFADWLDHELEQLVARNQKFCTPNSVKNSLGR